MEQHQVVTAAVCDGRDYWWTRIFILALAPPARAVHATVQSLPSSLEQGVIILRVLMLVLAAVHAVCGGSTCECKANIFYLLCEEEEGGGRRCVAGD
jgi:hypothetical protein